MKTITEITKEIKKEISSFEKDDIFKKVSNSAIAWQAFKIFRDSILTKCKPDFFTFAEAGFGGGNNGWVVGIYQPDPNPLDVWSNPIGVDRINVGLPNNTSYVNNIGSIFTDLKIDGFIPPTDLENLKEYKDDYLFVKEQMSKKHKFFKLYQQQQQEYIDYITQYIYTDVDDVRNSPQIGVMFGVFANSDTDNQEWNELVMFADRVDKANRIRKAKEKLFNFSNKIKNNYGINLQVIPAKKYFYQLSWNGIEIGEDTERIETYFKGLKALEKYNKDINQTRKEIIEDKLYIAYYHSFEGKGRKYIYLKGNTLEVPEKLMGQAIGKGGIEIKKIEKFWGIKIELIPIKEKAASFNWADFNFVGVKEIKQANYKRPKVLPEIKYKRI